MKGKKNKISSVYIFPVLFSIICLSYLIRFIFFNIETEIVKYGTVENVVHTTTLIIRNETAITLPLGVEIKHMVNEGDRVSSGKKILEIVKSSQADENLEMKIKQLDDRIREIKQSDINNSFFSEDKEKIDSHINERVKELKYIAKSGNLEKLDIVKNDLVTCLYKKSLIFGEGSFFGKNLEQLQKEKSTLEGIYNNSIDVIYAQASGIVCHRLDGYEQILTAANIKDYKLNNIKEIMSSSGASGANNKDTVSGIKIVDNFSWYTCSLISADQARELAEGKKVRLRFDELDNTEVNGEIYKVSLPEGDTCLVIIKVNEQAKGFYKKRIVNMDIVKDCNEGFTVSAGAIVVKDNIKGVYALKKGMVKFIPVAVMNEEKGMCLVKNLDKEDSSFKSDYDPLKIFDEVITTTKRVKENQILTDKI